MQRKRKGNILLLGMTAMLAAMFLWVGCSGDTDEGGNNGENQTSRPTFAPEKPRIVGMETAFELITDNLKGFNETSLTDEQQSAVIALKWEGEGAISYNVYWSEESSRPSTAGLSGLTVTAAFARNLEPETEYYFWVEAVNPNGRTFSDSLTSTTGKKGPNKNNGGGRERGDYPKLDRFKVVPGDGSLTVTWDLFDRVAWYELYYAPVGTIKHLDIYNPIEFRYDSSIAVDLKPGAVDISGADNASSVSYKAGTSSARTGYTRPVYPFLTPLAANSGWEGYYVRDGVSRVDGDTRPIWGVDDLPENTFYKIMEIYEELAEPYQALDPLFSQAIPWDGEKAGTPGTPIKLFTTSTTITGLQNGTAYDVWLRAPNANGERGYSYVTGTPGAGDALAAPSTVQIFTAKDTTRDLIVYWSKVSGAESYRIYASKFDYTPNATMSYTSVDGQADAVYSLGGLQSDTTYYVWVVAEKDGLPGIFGTPATGKTGTAPAIGKIGDKIIAGTNEKVKTAVYVEVNDRNPLNAGSYILEDGTYLFDYVILFAANIRNRNCAVDGGDGCLESGPHVHFNPNVRHILENRDKYIKPLQDKGIKVLLGLLGDHDGISFGTMNDADRATFIADMKKDVEDYGLDGVDFDDEWGSKEDWDNWTNNYTTISPNSIWTYPTSSWGWPTSVTVYRNPDMGIVAGNGRIGTGAAPSDADMTRMWRESGESYYKTIEAARTALGPDKIVTLYEYNTGRYVTPSGEDNGTATRAGLEGLIDFALQPWYNQYIARSINGLPNSIYSPFGMDLSGKAYAAQNGAPNPPIVVNGNSQATNTVYDYATRFKNQATAEGGAYNMLYFYGLEESTNLLKHASADSRADVTKEEYISMMSEIVFGKKVLITSEGERGDYRKDW
jgi:hypothetical protein